MDQQEFADRTEAIKTRLYRTAYLYLGSEADALEAVDETVYRALRRLKRLTAWFHKYSIFTVQNFSFSTRWQRPDRGSGCCWAYRCWCRWRSTPQ